MVTCPLLFEGDAYIAAGRCLALHKGNKAGITGSKGQLAGITGSKGQGVQKCKKFMEIGELSPNNQTVPNL